MSDQKKSESSYVSLPEGRSYSVHFDGIENLPSLMSAVGLQTHDCLVVTDENVGGLYLDRISEAFGRFGNDTRNLVIQPGEASKSPEILEQIYDFALEKGISRSTPIIAVGGGVVGDIAGYAAATLLRGIPLVHVPTSLVAQVDSSIGGKTGLNHSCGKNLVGSFYQPRLVCTDVRTLSTLPDREWTSGMAEAIKHALIADVEFFSWIEKNLDRLLSRNPAVVAPFVARAATIKCGVVSEDEHEAGRRMILNFGHTFGHALERTLGYGTVTHGEAVMIGMRAALNLSVSLDNEIELERIDSVLDSIPVPPISDNVTIDELTASMTADKKRTANSLRFVVLREIGKAYYTSEVPAAFISEAWRKALAR